jgi:hypothetical protein
MQRDACHFGFDRWDFDVIIGLACDLRPAGNIATAMLAMARPHIAFICRVWMQRAMCAGMRLLLPLRSRLVRCLATLARRRAGIGRRLRRLTEFGFEFGHTRTQGGVFRLQSRVFGLQLLQLRSEPANLYQQARDHCVLIDGARRIGGLLSHA